MKRLVAILALVCLLGACIGAATSTSDSQEPTVLVVSVAELNRAIKDYLYIVAYLCVLFWLVGRYAAPKRAFFYFHHSDSFIRF